MLSFAPEDTIKVAYILAIIEITLNYSTNNYQYYNIINE